MAEISTNIILDGITLALRSAFPGSHIESNAVKQGLRQPAFIVLLVNAEVTSSSFRCSLLSEVRA